MLRDSHRRRGMTLVELLVVIIILGLLGVATAPAIGPSNNKRKLRDAAGSVSSHLLRAAADAVGSRSGRGAWLEADAATNNGATTTLRFCPGTIEADTTAAFGGGTSTSATRSVTLTPSYQDLTGATMAPTGSTLRLIGMPYEYALLPDAQTLALRTVNGAPTTTSALVWPKTAAGGSAFPCMLQIPPDRAIGGRTALNGNTCVDLQGSTFGVANYSHSWPSFSNSGPLRVTFDKVGRPKAVTACFGANTTAETKKVEPRTPIAFLVGFRDQVGQTYVANPTDDNPGNNLQRKDAWWVVIDPRAGTIFEVENATNSNDIVAAQKFIRQRLLNDPNAP